MDPLELTRYSVQCITQLAIWLELFYWYLRLAARTLPCHGSRMGSIPIGTAYSISMELVQIQQRRHPVKGRQPSVKYLVCGLILLISW